MDLWQRKLVTTKGLELFLGSKVAHNHKTNPKIEVSYSLWNLGEENDEM